jgi:predicted AAA+ superfamily ATPase
LPEVAKISTDAQKIQYLNTVLQTILYKDIIKRYSIREAAFLEKLLRYIADVVGSQISLRNIQEASAKYGRNEASLATVSKYLNYLQQPYLIHKVRRFDIKGKRLLEHNEKYYFNDLGMRNSFKVNLQEDIAKLIENVVYLHLKKCGYTVYVGAF